MKHPSTMVVVVILSASTNTDKIETTRLHRLAAGALVHVDDGGEHQAPVGDAVAPPEITTASSSVHPHAAAMSRRDSVSSET
jgi:hypothetical protein